MPVWGSKDDRLLETMRELFEKQTEIVKENTAQVAQLAAQTTQLSQQITQISSQQDAMRNDFNARWADLPKLYVPRQEHQAMGLDNRVIALEEFRIAVTKDISDIKLNNQQQVQTVAQSLQDKVSGQREALDGRSIAAWVSVAFFVLNILWTVLSHLILK